MRRYSKLEANGIARRIAANNDLSIFQPFSDDQIRIALQSLKDSTSAIEEHNRILKEQEQALLSFQENNDHARERWKRFAVRRQTKRTQEKQSIELAVRSLSDSFMLG